MVLEIVNVLICSCHYCNKLICIQLFALNAFGSILLCVHVRLLFVVCKNTVNAVKRYIREIFLLSTAHICNINELILKVWYCENSRYIFPQMQENAYDLTITLVIYCLTLLVFGHTCGLGNFQS